ncbi:MAG: glycosyltransferase family 1 protein [Fibrobacteres bacterium]|nr:glycosyltransferase family 1 protein [Fibrobacterota bacterium]
MSNPQMRSKSISIVYHNFAHKGGAENAIYWQIMGLKNRGYQVELITRYYDEKIWGNIDSFPCKIHLVRAKNISRYIRNLIMPFLLVKYLRLSDYLHPHNYPAVVWVALAKFIFRLNSKTISFIQEPNRILHKNKYDDGSAGATFEFPVFDNRTPSWLLPCQIAFERFLDTMSVRRMDKVLVNSNYSKIVTDRVYDIKSQVCLLGEPLDNISSSSAQFTNRKYFLAASRLQSAKNVKTVVEGYSLFLSKCNYDPPKLIIAGDGPDLKNIIRLIHELRIENHVIIRGYVPDEELPALFSGAICLVFLPIREPFGLVTIEAFLNYTPAIVSDEGGPSEVVRDSITGFTISPMDIVALADKLSWIVANQKLVRAMGEIAYKEASVTYSLEAFIKRFESVALGNV